MELTHSDGYRLLLEQISDVYTQGRVRAVQAVNAQLIEAYWQVGRHIVEFEQAGSMRAEYGKALISTLAADLGLRHGRGFSRSNLVYMRLLYQLYPMSQKPSHQLSWSHYVELLKLDDELERGFYEKQAIAERWSVPKLKQRVAQERVRTVLSANATMILLYRDIGQAILAKQQMQGWGARVIDRLSHDLKTAFPAMSGFSPRNLKYMRLFASAWPDRIVVQRTVAQLPWRSNPWVSPTGRNKSSAPCPKTSSPACPAWKKSNPSCKLILAQGPTMPVDRFDAVVRQSLVQLGGEVAALAACVAQHLRRTGADL